MAMSFKDVHTLPALVPIPQLDGHVITRSEDEGLCWVHDNGSYVVGMRFEGRDLLGGVVVVYSELEVITSAHNPVLAGHEATSANGDIGELEGLDDALCFIGPDVDVAAVEGGEDPWLRGVEIDALDTLTARK